MYRERERERERERVQKFSLPLNELYFNVSNI
jgi:hypothetical protein